MAASLAFSSAPARAGATLDFRFEDGVRLLEHQQEGGRVYISDQVMAGSTAPLVVFLHGTNRERRLHRWMRRGPRDLRRVIDDLLGRELVAPMLLAAPSQTRDAETGSTLWTNFDLGAFVSRTEDVLDGRAHISEDRVILVGHSGAGCNRAGGILRVATEHATLRPAGIVAIDVCMNDETGSLLGRAGSDTTLHVYWQPFTWPRDFDAFLDAASRLSGREDTFRRMTEVGVSPHFGIVRPALTDALERLVPATPEDSGARS